MPRPSIKPFRIFKRAFVMHDALPPSLASLVRDQHAQAITMLESLGHDPRRLSLIDAGDIAIRDALPILPPLGERLETKRPHAKREALNAILDFLAAHGTPRETRVAMPAGAPFGTLDIDTDNCTMCISACWLGSSRGNSCRMPPGT